MDRFTLFQRISFFLCLVFLIFPQAIYAFAEIPDVFVTPPDDFYGTQSLISATAPVKTITAKQIKASGAQNLAQVLNANLGSQVMDLYANGSRIALSLRGFGDNAAKNSLILLNGVPLSNPDGGGLASLSMLPVSEIAKIEILPASEGVLYGDQAVGGVINIITKAPKPKEREAAASYGVFNTQNIHATLGDIFKSGFGYRINAGYYSTDNYRRHNDNRVNHFNAALHYDFHHTQFYLRYWKINQHLQLPGALTEQQAAKDPRQASSNITFNNQDNDIFQFGLVQALNTNWTLQADASARSMSGVGALEVAKKPVFFQESRSVQTLEPKVSGIFNLGHFSLQPIFGAEFMQGQYGLGDVKSREKEGAGFIQGTLFITPNLKTVFGARKAQANYVLQQVGADQKNPRDQASATNLELSWQANPDWRFFARRATSFRFPKTDEQAWTLTGEPLNTQTGISLATGAVFNKPRLHSSVTLYRLDLKNEIMSIPISTAKYFIYNENLDPTRRTGVMLNAAFFVEPHWQINANYDFVNARFRGGDFQGKKMPFVAQNTWRLGSSYSFSNAWQLYLEGVFVGPRYPINDVANITTPLGGFTIYNLNLSYKKPHYTIALRINNLTDKSYFGYSVATYGQNQSVNTVFYPASGISALLSLSLKL